MRIAPRLFRFQALLWICLLGGVAASLVSGGGGPREAQAQSTGGTSGTSTVSASDFLIRLQRKDGDNWVFLTDFQRDRFFNAAQCLCRTPLRIVVQLSDAGLRKRSQFSVPGGTVKVLVGRNFCVTSPAQDQKCPVLASINLTDLGTGKAQYIETTSNLLFDGRTDGTCASTNLAQNLWLAVDGFPANETPDLLDDAAPQLKVLVDNQPPPQPGNLRVGTGDGALSLAWDSILVPDFGGYVAFCSRGEDTQVFDPSYYEDKQFVSAAKLCDSTAAAASTASTGSGIAESNAKNGTAFSAPAVFRKNDPAFVCSELLTTQLAKRITGLQNGIPYLVGIAATDKTGNVSPVTVVRLQTPGATDDFYEGYRRAGGEAEGGFCSVGAHGVGAHGSRRCGTLALAAFGFAVASRRRTARSRRGPS